MSPSKILFFICISFIVGIVIESFYKIPQVFLWVFLFLNFLVIIIFLFFKKDILIIFGFCFLFLILGIMRMQISEFIVLNDKLSKFNGKGQVVLTGVINDEPDVRDASQMLKIKAGDSIILVTTSRYPEFKYLDKIKLAGKLETPGEFEDDSSKGQSYKNYLMKDGIYSVMAFPKITVLTGRMDKINPSMAQMIYSEILFCKQKIRESIGRNFLPPQSLILEGTILGDNGAMTNDLKNKLNITGLRHVIAVSGTHVVILTTIIMYLLLAIGIGRGKAFYIAIIIICIYIVLTGLASSGVRAGIMGGIYLLAQKLGRQSSAPRLIIMAGAVMLAFNPLYLFYDAGFQLSFLAVMGLIYIEPFIRKFLFIRILSATFAAQIFTLPIMIYNFGNISFVAPITNLLVLPIVELLMILGFLVSVAGIFSNIFAWVLFVPCWFLLTYFVKVIDLFSQPWAMKTFQNVHWVWLVVSYILIAFSVWFLNKKYPPEFL
ncbi:MAG: ComEC/Rec2 family competence protein [Candidatus Staskawiczbacteria bacterium]|nr:ComEC/Rec2 family competence protein [Candidatus Staskawiczbacteria bacterium]